MFIVGHTAQIGHSHSNPHIPQYPPM